MTDILYQCRTSEQTLYIQNFELNREVHIPEHILTLTSASLLFHKQRKRGH
jgi:hypothetical protein